MHIIVGSTVGVKCCGILEIMVTRKGSKHLTLGVKFQKEMIGYFEKVMCKFICNS